ncbi:hypothetical protein C0J52_21189 [Blattella germanica]|nr:hypothetical protein C0J52_21189 [Blattella germanica]
MDYCTQETWKAKEKLINRSSDRDIQYNLKEKEFVIVEFNGQKYPGDEITMRFVNKNHYLPPSSAVKSDIWVEFVTHHFYIDSSSSIVYSRT